MRFGEKEIAKEKFYGAKTTIKMWDVNVDNIVFSKVIETKTNSNLIGIKFDKLLRNYNEKLLKKYSAVWTKIEDLKSIELNALPVYDDRYIKTYDYEIYPNFRGLNVQEDDIECESFTIISIDSLLVYGKKHYLQVYLDNCAYKIVNRQMTDFLDKIFFKD